MVITVEPLLKPAWTEPTARRPRAMSSDDLIAAIAPRRATQRAGLHAKGFETRSRLALQRARISACNLPHWVGVASARYVSFNHEPARAEAAAPAKTEAELPPRQQREVLAPSAGGRARRSLV